jgi:hypothetical protein
MNIEGEYPMAVYCHWDGYPSNMGPLLTKHYNTIEKVKELLALGDLSSLGSKVKPEPGQEHSFNKPAPDVTVAYHRDRGEPLRFSGNQSEEYNYVFDGNQWYLKEEDALLPLNDMKIED